MPQFAYLTRKVFSEISVENHVIDVSLSTFQEVLAVLRTAPPLVKLLVCRPEEGVLPSIEDLVRHI